MQYWTICVFILWIFYEIIYNPKNVIFLYTIAVLCLSALCTFSANVRHWEEMYGPWLFLEWGEKRIIPHFSNNQESFPQYVELIDYILCLVLLHH